MAATRLSAKRSYYVYLDAANDPYVIVLNSRQWGYLHKRLHPRWQQLASDSNIPSSSIALAPSNLTTALLIRDGLFRSHALARQSAHCL
jgi:hypothetical protein